MTQIDPKRTFLKQYLDAPEPNDDQVQQLAEGMEILVGVLGNVVSGLGEEQH
jgi:hypothetical protein